jgi:cytidine deaminase
MKDLLQSAIEAQKKSYSPYSKIKVGAAVLTDSGQIFSGCNVENASYGGTVCAERVAIFNAVSQGIQSLKKIVIVTDAPTPWPPCGMCRQVMSEFATEKLEIILANPQGKMIKTNLKTLFPMGFSPKHLKK